MRNKIRARGFGALFAVIAFLAFGCGSRPSVKVLNVVRTDGMDIERPAEGNVFLVVDLDAGRDLGSNIEFIAFLDACRLTDNQGGAFGNPGQKYDREKSPSVIKLWWNVPKEKTDFVLVHGRQRIPIDASLAVVVSSPASAAGAVPAAPAGGIAGGAKEDADAPVWVGDSTKVPKLLTKVEPVYSEEAQKAGAQGIVIVTVTTDVQGRVVDAKVIKSIPLLDAAVVKAVRQWVYEPMIIDGRPRAARFPITFQCSVKKK